MDLELSCFARRETGGSRELKAPAALVLLLLTVAGYPHWPGLSWRAPYAHVSRPDTPTVTSTVFPASTTAIVPAISTIIPEERGARPETGVVEALHATVPLMKDAPNGQSVRLPFADVQGASTPASPPTTTVVTPIAMTVVSSQSTVAPLEGEAEANTAPLGDGLTGSRSSSSPFAGVRGAFIGAGIAIGAVVVATAAVRGARAVAKRRRR